MSRAKNMSRAKKLKRLKRRAAHLPNHMLHIAASKAYRAPGKRKSSWRGQAKWGAASEVRHIDPAEYRESDT